MAISAPTILLPQVTDLTKWAVIACDQFTGEPEYWEQLTTLVGDSPSALQFILPEVWLEEQIETAPGEIREAMSRALNGQLFTALPGYVLVERTLPSGVQRLGLMANIDLIDYEYTPSNTARIKATEATVPDRLPPRVAIRVAAPLEMPHALVLIDDPDSKVIERLYDRRNEFQLVYDFDLNMGGGHLRGWLIPDDADAPTSALLNLEKDGLLAVVGDGNHSIAAAKLTGDTRALVELVNIHSDAIEFEPIHRIIIGASGEFAAELTAQLAARIDPNNGTAETNLYRDGGYTPLTIPANPADAIADIQQIIDEYASTRDIIVDYIHGDKNLVTIADRHFANGQDAVAIFLPAIDKSGLFDYAARRGVLPRKAFSIGHAEDKRYYLELAERG